MSAVRWGILSTAAIGRVVAGAVHGSPRAAFTAVASRDVDRARSFADDLGLAVAADSYQELLARDDVDAIYVPLPISLHTEWTIRALEAGKHVLCEKPFALTALDAARCFDAAGSAGRVVLEALMWRHHPQTALARRLLSEGRIGRLAMIRAALSVSVVPGDIRRTAVLGGGAVLDLGCYCVSALRLFGGEPREVRAIQVLDPAPGAEGCDLRLAATMSLPDGVLGQFDVGLDITRRDELELIGTEGKIVVLDPWLCRSGAVELYRGGEPQRLDADPDGAHDLRRDESDAYRIELETASAVIRGEAEQAFGRADAVAQAAAIEAVRRAARDGGAVRVTGTGPRLGT